MAVVWETRTKQDVGWWKRGSSAKPVTPANRLLSSPLDRRSTVALRLDDVGELHWQRANR